MTPVAIVTGGTRGLGRAIVDRLLADGWRVLAVSASGEWGGSPPGASENVAVRATEIRDGVSCAAAVADAIERWGALDHLVNNAAIARDAPFADLTSNDWNAVIGTNLTGTFNMTKAALAAIVRSERGRIVNIGSVAATMGSTHQVNYSAAKAGLAGFTRALAREVAASGTTVNIVVPGPTMTGMGQDTSASFSDVLIRKTPLRRLGRSEETAHAVRFLLDDLSGFITGTTITVDGGLSMV